MTTLVHNPPVGIARIGTNESVTITIDGTASPMERVAALAILEKAWRDGDEDPGFARCRIEAHVRWDGRSTVKGSMILDNGRPVFAWSKDHSLVDAMRDVSARLRVELDSAATWPALRTA
jgi:hypothetical protein